MSLVEKFGPALLAMVIIAIGSAFFSCSEAALFSLQADDRRSLKKGSPSQRLAVRLLMHPEKLLMAILFWNLLLNILYFAIASLVSIKLEQDQRHTEAGLMAVVSLILLILVSELLPKTLGVMVPQRMARLVALPLGGAVKLFGPLSPMFSAVNAALRRVLFPKFEKETYLQLEDLEQAISFSTPNEELAAQERLALRSIVQFSDLTAEELMRPRTHYRTFTPPVHLSDLEGEIPRSGYLLVTEPESEEIVGAIALKLLSTIPRQHLEHFAQPVVYVPWCAIVAAVFDELNARDREVAAIVNEFGETIGIVTLEDLLQTIFEDETSRSTRLLSTASVRSVEGGRWQVTGMTSLRRLARMFDLELPKCKSTTVAGVVQEVLQRIPEVGDEALWGPFHFRVNSIQKSRNMDLELALRRPEEGKS